MKLKRRFLSILLMFCMMITFVPTGAMAADIKNDIRTSSDSVKYELSDTDGINDTITFSGNGEITKQVLKSFFLSDSSDLEYKDRTSIKYIIIGQGITGSEKSINRTNAVFTNVQRIVIYGKGNFSFGDNFLRRPATKELSVISERDSIEVGISAFERVTFKEFPIEQVKKIGASGFQNATLPIEGTVLKLFLKDNIDLAQMNFVSSVGRWAFSGAKNNDGINFTSAEITISGNVIFGDPSQTSEVFGMSDTIENLRFILKDSANFRLVNGAVTAVKEISFEGNGSVGFAYRHSKAMTPISGLNKAVKLETMDFEDFKGDIIFPKQTLGKVSTGGRPSYEAAEKGVLSSVIIGEGCNVQIEENAFDGAKAIKNFGFSKGTFCSIEKYAFRNTPLTEADLSNVSSIGYCAFDNVTGVSDWSSINTAAEKGILKKLEYSNVFLNTDSVWDLVQKEMEGKFALNQNGDYSTLTPSNNNWEDSKIGMKNATEAASTQLTKSAKWINDDKTSAQIEIQATYTPNQQMDFIFVLDTSSSMQLVNDENTTMGKIYQMFSKVSDVTNSLLSAKDIDSRVAFVSFGKGVGDTSLGFYEKEHREKANETIRNLKIAGNNTDFAAGLEKAIEYVKLAKQSNRNVSIVFLSDGEANQNTDRLNTVAEQIKTLGVETIGVLYRNPSSEEKPEYMETVCSKYYLANDTEEFSNAINRTIYDAFRSFTLTDKISGDFKAITDKAVSVTGGTFDLDEDGKTIIWNLSDTKPYQTYIMIIDVELAKDAEGNYPEKIIPTNDGTAFLTEIESGNVVNQVESPRLNRVLNINVSYQFVGNIPEGVTVPDSEIIKNGTEYITKKITEVDGYRFDGWYENEDCTIPFTDGKQLFNDIILYGKWLKKTPVEHENGNLTVSKTVVGNAGEKDREFHFTLTLGDTAINGKYGDLEFQDGIATFTLKHGESKTVSGLPVDITYEVTETEANQDGYNTSSVGATGIITDDNATASFINTKNSSESGPGSDEPDKPIDQTAPNEPEQNSEAPNPNGSNSESSMHSPETGTDINIELLLLLMGTGFFGIIVSLILKGKNIKQEKHGR